MVSLDGSRLTLVVATQGSPLRSQCVSVDLEVGRKYSQIHRFAAVAGVDKPPLIHARGALGGALRDLDWYCADARFLLEHNLIRFDLPQLQAAQPDLQLLRMPAIDTLWLNPLAFPCNPYHHLVKHYKDGQMQSDRLNDPELDVRLVLTLLDTQVAAFTQVGQNQRDQLLVWHWLTSLAEAHSGFDAVFASVRAKGRPTAVLARPAMA